MRTIEARRGYFRGTHKGYEIEIERDHEHHNKNFYIRVTSNLGEGMADYDGWAPDDVRTMPQAKREAILGAQL